MTLGHLVEDLHPLLVPEDFPAPAERSARIADMDEGAGQPGSMHGERIADGGLHQEAVQHRAVIAVVIKAIGEPRVTVGGIGVGSPDDALVQVGDADLVVLVVVEEEQLIERLRHVIDAAGLAGWRISSSKRLPSGWGTSTLR